MHWRGLKTHGSSKPGTSPGGCYSNAPRKAELSTLDVARGQGAKSWELRAATSLARLYRDQGRHERAHELLACVYEWFTEGFETPDLQEAKGLLEELTAA
jgi:predicted ATPase